MCDLCLGILLIILVQSSTRFSISADHNHVAEAECAILSVYDKRNQSVSHSSNEVEQHCNHRNVTISSNYLSRADFLSQVFGTCFIHGNNLTINVKENCALTTNIGKEEVVYETGSQNIVAISVF